MTNLKNLFRDESGVTAIEYALIAALIAVVIIVALQFLGAEVSQTFASVSNAINAAQPANGVVTGSGAVASPE